MDSEHFVKVPEERMCCQCETKFDVYHKEMRRGAPENYYVHGSEHRVTYESPSLEEELAFTVSEMGSVTVTIEAVHHLLTKAGYRLDTWWFTK